jgi:pyruvate/2-oxoglutarate dehydrogenase complex dihydrolipoamide dehydrogenase (E3) component
MRTYDFIVIGGGSAGFNAARLACSLGLKVAIIDGAPKLGGLCILKGCMPSKTLLHAAHVLQQTRSAATFGIKVKSAKADMKVVAKRKNKIIHEFASFRESQLKKGPFELIRAHASFIDAHTLKLSTGESVYGKHILIATGSKVSTPNIPGLASTPYWTSDDVLNLDFLPKSVIVLGGGIVACELSQYLQRMGSKVTLIQRSEHLLRDHSSEAGGVLAEALKKEGMVVFTGTEIKAIRSSTKSVSVKFKHKGKTVTSKAAYLFNALGREPALDKLNLSNAGVRIKADGRIHTNRFQQTSVPHIYAAGDCSGPVEIVHIAIQQGELAARHAAKQKKKNAVDYTKLLSVVFTDPAIASIGLSEKQLIAAKTKFISASYPFNDHGKSILMESNYGYVKVYAEPKKGKLLGAEIIGPEAGELIHLFSTPIVMQATVFDMLKAPWYHPTLAEIITYPLEEIADQVKIKPKV